MLLVLMAVYCLQSGNMATSHTHTLYAHTLKLTHAPHTHSLIHTHTHSISCTHRTHSHVHTRTHTHSHTHTHSCIHVHTHSHTHSLSHIHTLSRAQDLAGEGLALLLPEVCEMQENSLSWPTRCGQLHYTNITSVLNIRRW